MKIILTFLISMMLVIQVIASSQKYALVTGASRGIGRALVEELLEKDENLRVFAVARSGQDLEKLMRAYQDRVIAISADVSQVEGVEKILHIVRSTLAQSGTLLYLIHNAAIISPLGDLHHLQQLPLSSLFSMMETSYLTNVIAPHILTLELLPELKKASEARVLFVSSRAGDVPVPGAVTYSCTKAALDHLAVNLSASLTSNVGIGLLHPGEVDTDMQADLRTPSEDQMQISKNFRSRKDNNQLISPLVSAQFIMHLLYETSLEEFSKQKWDIYFLRPQNLPDELIQAIGSPPLMNTPLQGR